MYSPIGPKARHIRAPHVVVPSGLTSSAENVCAFFPKTCPVLGESGIGPLALLFLVSHISWFFPAGLVCPALARAVGAIDNTSRCAYHTKRAGTNLEHFGACQKCMRSAVPWGGQPVSAAVYHATGREQSTHTAAPYARSESGPLALPEAQENKHAHLPVCLNTHICNVLREEEPHLLPQIVIRRRVNPDGWPVRGDGGLLEELVLALTLNALDAIEDEGRVTLETRNLRLEEGCITRATGLTPGPYVLLTVEDTGRGVDANALARIFEPAGPSEIFSNRPVLAGAKRIVDLHRGHVCVFSMPGEGTVVRVYLPAEPPQQAPTGGHPTR